MTDFNRKNELPYHSKALFFSDGLRALFILCLNPCMAIKKKGFLNQALYALILCMK